jgi:hypothetical protein
MPRVDAKHPANQGVHKGMIRTSETLVAPPRYPFHKSGTHPDVVERVWEELGFVLPRGSRCMLYGRPALADPATGVVFVVCFGTQYALRLPPDAIPKERRTKAWSTTRWSDGGTMNVQKALGPDWVFGRWKPVEAEWLRAVYERHRPGEGGSAE